MRAYAGKLASALHGTSMEAWGFQRVLDKKRDPTTRALLDATVRADRSGGLSLSEGVYRGYWSLLCSAVRGAVERALEAEGVGAGGGGGGGGGGEYGGGVALVAMYPFLRKAFLRLIRRLEEGTSRHQGSSARRSDGVNGGVGVGAGAGAVSLWSKSVLGTGGGGGGQQPVGGILGGSRWLSLALDNGDDLSFDPSAEGDEQERQSGRRGGGAEAGAGPTGNGRRAFGLRGSSPGTGGGGGAGSRGDDDSSDGARLLEALGPLRDLFLARSLERLTTPVEQMFPQVRARPCPLLFVFLSCPLWF